MCCAGSWIRICIPCGFTFREWLRQPLKTFTLGSGVTVPLLDFKSGDGDPTPPTPGELTVNQTGVAEVSAGMDGFIDTDTEVHPGRNPPLNPCLRPKSQPQLDS